MFVCLADWLRTPKLQVVYRTRCIGMRIEEGMAD